MEVTIYFEDGTRKTIHHVDDISWSRQNVYIDVWNKPTDRYETFTITREMISQILINNI